MKPTPARLLNLLAGALLAALLAACGGQESDAEANAQANAQAAAQAPAEARARALALAPTVIPPLIDDAGRVMPAAGAAVPHDPGARTRNRHYATPAQAAQLEEVMGELVIPVNVERRADDTGAVELATQMVWGQQVVHDLPATTPVLVRSADLRLAAATVHHLEALGYSRVFLVTH